MRIHWFLVCSLAVSISLGIAQWYPLTPRSPAAVQSRGHEILTAEDIHYCGASLKDAFPSDFVDGKSLQDDGSVWRVGTARWNESYEAQYSDWFSKNITEDFLVQHSLKADCADSAMIIRSVFARIHHLPVLFQSNDNSKGIGHFTKTFSKLHTSDQWDPYHWKEALKEDQRFRAFLSEARNVVSSATFWTNTYPLEIYDPYHPSRISHYLRPGVLHAYKTHVEIISAVDSTRWFPIRQYSATTPASVQKFTEYYSELSDVSSSKIGVVGWNWVVNCGNSGWRHVDSSQMPGYSLQQVNFSNLNSHMINAARAKSIKVPTEAMIRREIDALGESLKNRVQVVLKGYEEVQRTHGHIANMADFEENYTTPTFDQRVVNRYIVLENLVKTYGSQIPLSWDQFVGMLLEKEVDVGFNGKKSNLYFFITLKRYGNISSDGRDSLEKRWGLDQLGGLRSYYSNELKVTASLKEQVEARLKYNLRYRSQYPQWIRFDQNQLNDLNTRYAIARRALGSLSRLF